MNNDFAAWDRMTRGYTRRKAIRCSAPRPPYRRTLFGHVVRALRLGGRGAMGIVGVLGLIGMMALAAVGAWKVD